MKKKEYAYAVFVLAGTTWTYTGAPNFDELSEAPWYTPRMAELEAAWFAEPGRGPHWTMSAGEYLRALIEAAGGRIELRSVRADGSVQWEDFRGYYVR